MPAPRPPADGRARSGGGRRPARPSQRTFRRRRLAVLVAAVVVLGLIVWGVVALAGSASPTEPAAETASPSPTVSDYPLGATPPAPVACTAQGATLTVTAPQAIPSGGAATALVEVAVPADAVPCLVDLGSSAVTVAVYSGEDLLWSSGDCPFTPSSRRLLLPSGSTDSVNVSWNGHRASAGCGSDGEAALPGTYRFEVTHVLDGVELRGDAVFLVE